MIVLQSLETLEENEVLVVEKIIESWQPAGWLPVVNLSNCLRPSRHRAQQKTELMRVCSFWIESIEIYILVLLLGTVAGWPKAVG